MWVFKINIVGIYKHMMWVFKIHIVVIYKYMMWYSKDISIFLINVNIRIS